MTHLADSAVILQLKLELHKTSVASLTPWNNFNEMNKVLRFTNEK